MTNMLIFCQRRPRSVWSGSASLSMMARDNRPKISWPELGLLRCTIKTSLPQMGLGETKPDFSKPLSLALWLGVREQYTGTRPCPCQQLAMHHPSASLQPQPQTTAESVLGGLEPKDLSSSSCVTTWSTNEAMVHFEPGIAVRPFWPLGAPVRRMQ